MAKRKKKSAMTASTFTQLPLMAGSALLGTLSRAGHWTFAHYMRAPLASTGLLALVTLTALAGSNALYFQTTRHPSPFFAPASDVPMAIETAPVPAPSADRPIQPAVQSVPTIVSPETTGSVAPQTVIPDAPVGNERVFAVQKRLAELNMFEGTVDGYYGPKTAQAIRAFENLNGLTPTGALDDRVVEAILSADANGRMATPVAIPAPAPQPVVVQPQAAAPAPAPAPVAAPAVQQASLAPQPMAAPQPAPVQQDQVVARLPALSPAEQVFDEVAQSAANTVDSIISAVDGSRSRPSSLTAPPIPTGGVPQPVAAPAVQPQPVAVAPRAAPQPVQMTPTVPTAQAAPATQQVATAEATTTPPASDAELVMQIQRGLASLGFFRAPIDGKPGPETARAIREFENFHSYKITGQVQPDLVGLLRDAGATI